MTRRNLSDSTLEIVPREGPVAPLISRAMENSLEARQLGPRLQKLYTPCTEQQVEISALAVQLDRKLEAI